MAKEQEFVKYMGQDYLLLEKDLASGTALIGTWNEDGEVRMDRYEHPVVVDMKDLEGFTLTCPICGEEFEIADMTRTEDGYVCDDCVALEYEECDDCGKIVKEDSLTTVYNGDRVCESCLDNYFQCDRCEEYVPNTTETPIGDLCQHCLEEAEGNEEVTQCAECGEYFHSDDVNWDDYGDQWLCDSCWDILHMDDDGPICGYHDSRDPVFKSLNSETGHPLARNTYIGVEHELSGVGEKNYELAETLVDNYGRMCETDSSIWDGFECISDPLTFLYWKEREDVDEYMELCVNHGLNPDVSSGIHVHISRNNGLDDEAVEGIIEFVFSNFAKCLKFGRRNPNRIGYCRYYDIVENDREDWAYDLHNIENYCAVNLEYSSHLELRFFQTTANTSHFWAIIEFAHCLAEVAKTHEKITWESLRAYAIKDGKCEHFLDELDHDFDCPEVAGIEYDVDYAN